MPVRAFLPVALLAACSLAVPLDEYSAGGEVELDRGLVGYWRLDDGLGESARDGSGRAHHAALRNHRPGLD